MVYLKNDDHFLFSHTENFWYYIQNPANLVHDQGTE